MDFIAFLSRAFRNGLYRDSGEPRGELDVLQHVQRDGADHLARHELRSRPSLDGRVRLSVLDPSHGRRKAVRELSGRDGMVEDLSRKRTLSTSQPG